MSETEAHKHLQQLIEFMNACLSKAIQGQLFEEDWKIFDQVFELIMKNFMDPLIR